MIELSVTPVLPVGLLIRALKPYDDLGDGGTAALSLIFSDRTNGAVLEMSISSLGCT